MATIYRYLNPVTVTQERYNSLITREGYFATPTAQPNLDTPINVSTPVLNAADFKDLDATGVKDVTSTIQAAMNKAVATGTELYIGPGLYSVKTLNVPHGLVMRGCSPSGTGTDVSKQTRFGLIAGTNAHMLKGAVGSAHVRISNIHFDGNKNNNTSGDIIHLDDAGVAEEGQWHIRDCFFDAAAGYGVYVGAGRRAVQISDSSMCYSRLSGIRMAGSDGHIDRCIIGTNLEHGIGVAGTVCNINDCDIYGNGTSGDNNTGDGISVFSTITMASIRGNRIDQNKRHGVLIGNSCESITVTGNMFHGNSQHNNGSHNGVHVLSTTGSITVSDNVCGVDGNVSNKSGVFVGLGTNATVQGTGNVMQSGSTVNGMTNNPRAFAQTKVIGKVNEWAPSAAIVQNVFRENALIGNQTAATIGLASGVLLLAGGLTIPAGVKVSSATILTGNNGPASGTHAWMCLVDIDKNILAKSADDTGVSWVTNNLKTYTFTSPYTPDTDKAVYVGLLITATTMPDLRVLNSSNVANEKTPPVSGTTGTALTTPASLTSVGTITGNNCMPYVYLS